MSIRLKTKCQPPYGGGFSINDPEKGFVGYGVSFESLTKVVRAYREANALPVGLGFEDELETEICKKYAAECEHYDATIPRVAILGVDTVLRGTEVLANLVAQWGLHKVGLAESPLVDEGVAAQRLVVCNGCQYNVEMRSGCGGLCGKLLDVVNKIRGSRAETPGPLKACSICSCFTGAHVHIIQDLLDTGTTETMKAQFSNIPWCWKRTNA